MKYIKHFIDLNKIIIAILISRVLKLSKMNKDIWLISERRDEAEDNAFHLYKYIRENHPTQKAYYVIDKKSHSYLKITKFETIIQQNSLRHYIYYFLAEKHLSAFQFFGVPETPILWRLESYGLIKKKKVFLQHGITKEILPFLNYANTKYNLFVCGAKPEFDFVKEHFGYPKENVKYLGFCRFDNLHDYKVKNQILLMPTWRQWFGMTNSDNNTEMKYDEFIMSEYYHRYNNLLNSVRIHEFLEKHDIKLIFYPHPEMQRFIKAFNCNNSNITIANRNNYNLQNLLKESRLLITDYSSVAFDFAYMRKPLIYYQFDQQRYYTDHFQKGYFDCNRDGFGPVIRDEKILIDCIEKFMLKDSNDEKYNDRVGDFFQLYDKENCKRHYEVISSI
ncbi:CDP-glycerol glycerophosphotransferase family protein [Bacillus sp. OK048]|uniref:CDP-glycerol glycerophosphotransferase family protein n=1 Tax=Bacillus sp. OK048 TaxID=1882761 RepID=UPI00087E5BB7|nr:CDP-glycerol glycerophosphotransferase family protein [Bacillus sp. OK048]SDM78198.1 CDP-glycerol glycerophosphotransferase, TagB/SpsB family [Bacillus sp. OK048]